MVEHLAGDVDSTGAGRVREPWSVLGRLAWIVPVLLTPLLWGVFTMTAGPSDATASYPSTSLNGGLHWGYEGGVPISAVFGSSPLQPGPSDQDPAWVTAVTEPSSGQLVPLENWVGDDNIPPVTRRSGESVTYQLRQVDGSSDLVAVVLGPYPVWAAVRANIGSVVLFLSVAAGGAFVFWHRPRDPAARVLLSLGLFGPLGMTEFPFGVQVIDLAGGRGVWPHVVGDVSNTFAWGSVLLFTLVFPQPLPIFARRRWLFVAPYLFMFLLYGLWAATVPPLAHSDLARLEAYINVSGPAARVTLPLAAVVLIWSYRHSEHREQRLALRVILAGVLISVLLYVVLGQIPHTLFGQPIIPWAYLPLALVVPFVALIVAVLRYRLIQIDLIVRRSLLVAPVAVAVIGVFLLAGWLISLVLQAVAVRSGTHQTVVFVLAVALGGFLAAALLPVGRLLRRRLGRLAYGERENPFMVVSQLRTVNADDPIREAMLQILSTLRRTLRLCYAHIEVNNDTDGLLTVTLGGLAKRPAVVVLRTGDHELGRMLLDVQPGREPFGPKDARLLDEIGAQVGAVVEALLINRDLRSSQERIITIRDEERRRIRRDLHDDVLSQLAALVLQVDSARSSITKDAAATDVRLAHLEDGIRAAIANVRRIVNGLGPTVLDREDLVTALRRLAEDHSVQAHDNGHDGHQQLRYEVHADQVEPIPEAVKLAAYRIVVEAFINAARHSGATVCRVHLMRNDSALAVSVTDDGRGFAGQQSAGIGLDSMTKRAQEVGGSLTVTTRAGTGTTVAAELPIVPGRRVLS